LVKVAQRQWQSFGRREKANQRNIRMVPIEHKQRVRFAFGHILQQFDRFVEQNLSD